MWYRIKVHGPLLLTFDVKATLRLIWNKNKKGEKKKEKTRNHFALQFPRPFCRLAGNSYHGRCDYFAACRGLINVKSNIGGSSPASFSASMPHVLSPHRLSTRRNPKKSLFMSVFFDLFRATVYETLGRCSIILFLRFAACLVPSHRLLALVCSPLTHTFLCFSLF